MRARIIINGKNVVRVATSGTKSQIEHNFKCRLRRMANTPELIAQRVSAQLVPLVPQGVKSIAQQHAEAVQRASDERVKRAQALIFKPIYA
jgi:hypothetical protein